MPTVSQLFNLSDCLTSCILEFLNPHDLSNLEQCCRALLVQSARLDHVWANVVEKHLYGGASNAIYWERDRGIVPMRNKVQTWYRARYLAALTKAPLGLPCNLAYFRPRPFVYFVRISHGPTVLREQIVPQAPDLIEARSSSLHFCLEQTDVDYESLEFTRFLRYHNKESVDKLSWMQPLRRYQKDALQSLQVTVVAMNCADNSVVPLVAGKNADHALGTRSMDFREYVLHTGVNSFEPAYHDFADSETRPLAAYLKISVGSHGQSGQLLELTIQEAPSYKDRNL